MYVNHNQEVVDRLIDAYEQKINEYRDAERSGSGLADTIWGQLVLLGEILGKDVDGVWDDLSSCPEDCAV